MGKNIRATLKDHSAFVGLFNLLESELQSYRNLQWKGIFLSLKNNSNYSVHKIVQFHWALYEVSFLIKS